MAHSIVAGRFLKSATSHICDSTPSAAQTAPTCEDGSTPVWFKAGYFTCHDGSEPTCPDGLAPTFASSGALLYCEEPSSSPSGAQSRGQSSG